MDNRAEVTLAGVVADDGGGQARVERLSPSADGVTFATERPGEDVRPELVRA